MGSGLLNWSIKYSYGFQKEDPFLYDSFVSGRMFLGQSYVCHSDLFSSEWEDRQVGGITCVRESKLRVSCHSFYRRDCMGVLGGWSVNWSVQGTK